jgi:glycerate dehydrogenase
MNIVVLDGFTANPGDCSWEPLKALGTCQIYDRSLPEEVLQRAQSADVLLTNKTPLSREILLQLPRLKCIGVLATGYNVVDIDASRERGIPVCNVPEYGTPNTAQAAIALLLELTNRTGHHAETVRAGRWSRSADFCYWDGTLTDLQGATLGIFGFGRIGEMVARIGSAFGMRILAHRRNAPEKSDFQHVGLEQLLRESDVVSLHCPLTEHTREVINAERLRLMKPSAFLINTARGALIHEADLAAALNAGVIAGAGLDVLSVEPPPPTNPLLSARNCIITPHIAWATPNARRRLLATTVENIQRWMEGQPQNVVNPERQ